MNNFILGPVGDPLRLWYVERQDEKRERRYFSSRKVARDVVKLLRLGKLDFDNDSHFAKYV